MTAINPAILETVLARLALLFLAGAAGDATAARLAARQMLAAYAPETPDELSLAAEIISFHLHALEALAPHSMPVGISSPALWRRRPGSPGSSIAAAGD